MGFASVEHAGWPPIRLLTGHWMDVWRSGTFLL